MYLKDWIELRPITAYYDRNLYFYIRYENETEYRQIKSLSEFDNTICLQCRQITHIDGAHMDLYVYYDLKVKTIYTLKDFIDTFEISKPAILKVKGQKLSLVLNSYNFYKYRDHIVRGFRVGKDNSNYIWIK